MCRGPRSGGPTRQELPFLARVFVTSDGRVAPRRTRPRPQRLAPLPCRPCRAPYATGPRFAPRTVPGGDIGEFALAGDGTV